MWRSAYEYAANATTDPKTDTAADTQPDRPLPASWLMPMIAAAVAAVIVVVAVLVGVEVLDRSVTEERFDRPGCNDQRRQQDHPALKAGGKKLDFAVAVGVILIGGAMGDDQRVRGETGGHHVDDVFQRIGENRR